LPDSNSISDEVTGGGGAAIFGEVPGKFKEVIPEAQKV
jgi:hypothetical protein